MQGLILSGGEGTRLGPLGLQRSKCLISVGGKPMLVRQYELLKSVGCDEVTVVVSPRGVEQVVQAIESTGLPIFVRVQEHPHGPVHGLITGLTSMQDINVQVLFADTLLDAGEMPLVPNTVVIADAPRTRNFTRFSPGHVFRDELTEAGKLVAVGAFYFKIEDAERAAHLHKYDAGIADFLNTLHPRVIPADTWQDVGDLESLAEANRTHFIARNFNELYRGSDGVITKEGPDLASEIAAVEHPPETARSLYPAVYGSWKRGRYPWYAMEFIPQPTLAELYLYWPREPQLWDHITRTLVRTLRELHWPVMQDWSTLDAELRERASRVYVDGLLDRYGDEAVPELHRQDAVNVNGRPLVVGERLINTALQVGDQLAELAKPAMIHGDPNFTNVLWSLETSTFKLVDPRGKWGGAGSLGDLAYDAAKIAYSPIFSRIAHGLFDLKKIGKHHYALSDLRTDYVIDRELFDLFEDTKHMRMLVAWLLLAGAPLHQGDEATALYLTGARMMQEWV